MEGQGNERRDAMDAMDAMQQADDEMMRRKRTHGETELLKLAVSQGQLRGLYLSETRRLAAGEGQWFDSVGNSGQ